MDDKITDENNLSSRKPKFGKKVAKKDRIYCQICLVGCEQNIRLDAGCRKTQKL